MVKTVLAHDGRQLLSLHRTGGGMSSRLGA
jgi:hypothetical protein